MSVQGNVKKEPPTQQGQTAQETKEQISREAKPEAVVPHKVTVTAVALFIIVTLYDGYA